MFIPHLVEKLSLLWPHEFFWRIKCHSKLKAFKLSYVSVELVISSSIPPFIEANNNNSYHFYFYCFLFFRHSTECFTHLSSFNPHSVHFK